MNDEKKNLTEYEEKKSDDDKATYSKKNVQSIKRLIVAIFIIMCAIPVLLCLYLMARMNEMERRLDDIAIKLGSRNESVIHITEDDSASEVDIMKLEEAAYDDLSINTEEASVHLSLAEEMHAEAELLATGEAISQGNAEQVTNDRKVYLTFDDGPSIYTGEILDILKKNNVKATFFVVYNDDESLWPYYDRIVDEGHTLAMHSYSHVYDTIYASQESFEEDVNKIHDFLLEQTGIDCKYYRFPGGSSNMVSNVDIESLIGYLYSNGYTYYDWNALSGDAVDMELTADELNDTVLEYVRGNQEDSIVLLHDLKNNYATIEGLQSLIDTLIEEGFEICPISDQTEPVQHVTFDVTE